MAQAAADRALVVLLLTGQSFPTNMCSQAPFQGDICTASNTLQQSQTLIVFSGKINL